MATATQVANFINRIAPIAVEQAKKHKGQLYASVAIAQAAHESGWGTSAKMVRANALMGVKVGKSAYKFGTAWKGKAYKSGTTEYYDGVNPTEIMDFFRAYDNISDSIEDYMDMLCHCQRYKKALNQPTPENSITEIVKGGYATGPNYAKAIMQIIKTYSLQKYDGVDVPEQNPYKLSVSLLKRGSIGISVAWLQFELCRHGYTVQIDKKFGPKTELAVVLFQKDHGLVADGLVGKKTIAALKGD